MYMVNKRVNIVLISYALIAVMMLWLRIWKDVITLVQINSIHFCDNL